MKKLIAILGLFVLQGCMSMNQEIHDNKIVTDLGQTNLMRPSWTYGETRECQQGIEMAQVFIPSEDVPGQPQIIEVPKCVKGEYRRNWVMAGQDGFVPQMISDLAQALSILGAAGILANGAGDTINNSNVADSSSSSMATNNVGMRGMRGMD